MIENILNLESPCCKLNKLRADLSFERWRENALLEVLSIRVSEESWFQSHKCQMNQIQCVQVLRWGRTSSLKIKTHDIFRCQTDELIKCQDDVWMLKLGGSYRKDTLTFANRLKMLRSYLSPYPSWYWWNHLEIGVSLWVITWLGEVMCWTVSISHNFWAVFITLEY